MPRRPRRRRIDCDPEADATLRVSAAAHKRLVTFAEALVRHDFLETREVRRVSLSDAIVRLLSQPEAKRIIEEWETLHDRNHDRL